MKAEESNIWTANVVKPINALPPYWPGISFCRHTCPTAHLAQVYHFVDIHSFPNDSRRYTVWTTEFVLVETSRGVPPFWGVSTFYQDFQG